MFCPKTNSWLPPEPITSGDTNSKHGTSTARSGDHLGVLELSTSHRGNRTPPGGTRRIRYSKGQKVKPDPAAIRATLLRNLTGGEPPADLLDQLGGWAAVEAIAPTLIDEPLLTPLMSLLVRDATHAARAAADLAPVRPAAAALAAAVLASTDPFLLQHNIDTLCSNPVLTDLVGAQVAGTCLTLATPPRTAGDVPGERTVLQHAVALEAAARLAVLGHISKYKVFGVLADVVEPQPRRYAQAVARTVNLAYDHWAPDDDLADVIDILTGAVAPSYTTVPAADVVTRNDEYRRDIAPDAMWAKANVEVARALRAPAVNDVIELLDAGLESLEFVTTVDDRDDAALLQSALRILRVLLVSLVAGGQPQDAATWDVALPEAETVIRRAEKFVVSSYGLNHWSGDRKIVVLNSWARFAHDLAWLRDQLNRDSLYDAAVVLDDVLAIYSASRSYDITRNEHGVEQLLNVIRPAVAGGFAARAGLLRNLVDHTDHLRGRLEAAEATSDVADDLRRRLVTAQTVLDAARASLARASEPPGKPYEQVAALPPLLDELVRSHPAVAGKLAGVHPADLAALAADLADRQAAADPDPDVMVTKVRKRVLSALSTCEDYVGDIATAANAVLDQLIKFVRQRLNAQESSKTYLFDANANEHALHVDLYEWLRQGQLGSATNVEVQEIGAGRVDIQIQFAGFHFYIELKADATAVPVADKSAYIKQAVAYQASDVRIGFLVVLRLKEPKDRAPSAHLTEYVSHATVQVGDGCSERHVVMLEVPGNQTKPSAVR